jgi:hypothetical protein
MILNLGQVCSMATTIAGGRLDFSLSEASSYANLAYHEVASRINAHRPKEALAVSSTSSGQNRMAMPADFDYSLALTLYIPSASTQTSTGTWTVPLRLRDYRWIDAQPVNGNNSLTNTTAGIPEAYVVAASWLELWPSPNSAYSMQLRYMTKTPMLINSTDTIILDDRWHQAVLFKTVEFLEMARNNVEGELLARNRYLSYVGSTPNDYALRSKERTGMVMRLKYKGDEGID